MPKTTVFDSDEVRARQNFITQLISPPAVQACMEAYERAVFSILKKRIFVFSRAPGAALISNRNYKQFARLVSRLAATGASHAAYFDWFVRTWKDLKQRHICVPGEETPFPSKACSAHYLHWYLHGSGGRRHSQEPGSVLLWDFETFRDVYSATAGDHPDFDSWMRSYWLLLPAVVVAAFGQFQLDDGCRQIGGEHCDAIEKWRHDIAESPALAQDVAQAYAKVMTP